MDTATQAFLSASRFVVVGASLDRAKYGNKVLRCYQQNSRDVVAVNPRAPSVEGAPTYPSLTAAVEAAANGDPRPEAVSVITPPPVTLRVIQEAAALGIRHVWLQPGAESPEVLTRAEELGLDVIAGGPCVLVVLGFRDV